MLWVVVGSAGWPTRRLRPHSHSATPTRAPTKPPMSTHSHGAPLGNPACVMPTRFSYDFTTTVSDPWCGTGHIITAPTTAPKKPPHPCWNKNRAQPGSGFMVYLPVQLLPTVMLRRAATPERGGEEGTAHAREAGPGAHPRRAGDRSGAGGDRSPDPIAVGRARRDHRVRVPLEQRRRARSGRRDERLRAGEGHGDAAPGRAATRRARSRDGAAPCRHLRTVRPLR